MVQPELTEDKKVPPRRKMPRLGRVSQWALLIGIFLILFIPGRLMYQQQLLKQAELNREFANLQTVLSTPDTERDRLQVQIKQAEAELLAAKE